MFLFFCGRYSLPMIPNPVTASDHRSRGSPEETRRVIARSCLSGLPRRLRRLARMGGDVCARLDCHAAFQAARKDWMSDVCLSGLLRRCAPRKKGWWQVAEALNCELHSDQATECKPLRETRVSSFKDAPRGCFSPRSHWLTRPVVTLR
jgi:hypothetical protein